MQITILASGSNGNSCIVEHKDTSILIDAGKSMKKLELRANNLGKSLDNIDAVIISHAHTDHCLSAGTISRKYNVPIYLTRSTHNRIAHKIGKVDARNIKYFSKRDFKINNLIVKPIKTSHDVPSCGFVIDKFGLFTDTGIVTDEMKKITPKLDGIVLESNHDRDMLIWGPYPDFLKKRVLSRRGHLSNDAASFLVQEKTKHLNWVLLAHLSGTNNTQEVVRGTFEGIVKQRIEYVVLSRDKESGIFDL